MNPKFPICLYTHISIIHCWPLSKVFRSIWRNTRRCSFFKALNSLSNWWCHGYRTKTWKANADEATAKLTSDIPRVTNMVKDWVLSNYLISRTWGKHHLLEGMDSFNPIFDQGLSRCRLSWLMGCVEVSVEGRFLSRLFSRTPLIQKT